MILQSLKSDTEFSSRHEKSRWLLRDLHKCARQERGALRAPANQLCHVEDEVAEHEESQ